jgi:hypothetical protein
MGKAVDQLTSERTKDALTHELTALNGLLQLQAQNRRQQVSQGSAGSGFGGNRAGQDLSALFDKELQRQQRTNYETRSAAEIKPDTEVSTSALDRIRELAKRQEDLNRRQRELTQSNLSPEEMKRQLEKLTREQGELREQTEELLRRVGNEANGSPQNRQSSSSKSEGAGNGGGETLRGAANDMRSATTDLRREAPGDAARNGERALNQLRRLEEQMSQQPAGASSTNGSDVKLEAQQISQEQRRIAGEALRLDRNSDASTADARRRLADDKERLASRVDEMARRIDQLAQSGGGRDSKAIGEAAQSLRRDKIADRMRAGAREMRQPSGGKHAAAEQELAATVEQLANKLGGDGSPLSSELEQTRAIRDRLQRSEQQLRDAEARAAASARGNGARGGEGQRDGGKGQGGGSAQSEVQRMRDEYQRELQRAEDALRRLQGASSGDIGGATPEEQEFSRSAPGTQAFKQDRSDWESLRRNLDSALEKYEASISQRASRTESKERFSAGGSDRVPDAYSQLISRYFESLAKKK